MTIKLYSTFDKQIERGNIPYYARNDQEAAVILIRSGIPETIYNDVELRCLGEYDDEKGVLISSDMYVCKLPPFPKERRDV